MSKYRFSIYDYHAIKEADILIDGITVLAGPNGCGKSTISRWLYYMIDIATDFDSYLVKGYKTEIDSLLQNISRAIREMWGLNRGVNNGLNVLQSIDDLKLDDNFSLGSIDEYTVKLHLFIGALPILTPDITWQPKPSQVSAPMTTGPLLVTFCRDIGV